MKKVAVFFGGDSSEREISVLTGVFVLNVIDRSKFTPLPLYLHSDGKIYTSQQMTSVEYFKSFDVKNAEQVVLDGKQLFQVVGKRKKLKELASLDVAINCCHGGLGEGGGVSALVEFSRIPLASPSVAPSGIFLDKALTKILAKGLNIPTVDWMRVRESDYRKRGSFLLKNVGTRLAYPVIVKPCTLGSSIGIQVARTEEELDHALQTAFELDSVAIIEKFLETKADVNCAAYKRGGEVFVSEPEVAAQGKGVYGFEEKYLRADGDRMKSGKGALTEKELAQKIRSYTKTLYKKTNLNGVVRMDFLVSGKNVYLSEVNTVPGSLAYYLFCERLTGAREFFTDLLEEAIHSFEKKKTLETGILHTVKSGGRKIRL